VEKQQHEVETENEISYPADADEDMISNGNEYEDGGETVNNSPHDSTDYLVATENNDGVGTEMMETRPTTTTMRSKGQKKATIAAAESAEQRSDKVSWPVAAQRTSSRPNKFKGTMKDPSDSIAALLKSNYKNNISNNTKGSSSKRRVTRQQSSRHSSFETKTEEDDDETGKKKMRISNSNNNVDISETTPLKQQITNLELTSFLEKESTPINNNSKRDDTSISSANSSNNSDDSYIYDLCGIFVPNDPTNLSLSDNEKKILRYTHKLQQLKNKVRTSEEDEQYKKYNTLLYQLCPEVSRGKRGEPQYPQFVPNRTAEHKFPTITGKGEGRQGGNGGKGGIVIDDASTTQERPTDNDMIEYFNNNEKISIGLRVRFKDVPGIYFRHHEYRTPHRNSRLIVSDEGDSIWTWIYNDEIYIRSKGGKDLRKDKYSKLKFPVMNGLMKSTSKIIREGKKEEEMRIHHLVFVTFSDDEAVERYFGGLVIDHINRNIGDSRWVNLRLATISENIKNRGVNMGKGHR
jgi:hypothetical protein